MKVRFKNTRRDEPASDGGMRVLYAPAKRTAYRLRWYLILALVASPFLWFLGRVFLETIRLEAPAQVSLPRVEIRAPESAQVDRIVVGSNETVSLGQPLIALDNPAYRSMLSETGTINLTNQGSLSLSGQQRQILAQLLNRAENRVNRLRQLVAAGAATRGELLAAENLRDKAELDLLDFDRTQASANQLSPGLQQQLAQASQARKVAEERLARLSINAPRNGRVLSIEVVEGENVGPGTLMMTLTTDGTPTVELFLEPKYSDLAQPGQPLQLHLPDGQWLDAVISGEPSEVRPLPPAMRSSFKPNQVTLVLQVHLAEPLPAKWHINALPLTARFPNPISRWWQRLVD